MSAPALEIQLVRCYRMLFAYETDPEAEWKPAWLTTMGQMDCHGAIRRLEAEIEKVVNLTENGLE